MIKLLNLVYNGMKLDKKHLMLIAGIVWLIAGFNIMRIGLQDGKNHWTIWMIFTSTCVFLLFHNLVFRKMVKKHSNRIQNLENEKNIIFRFFDKKAYLIMTFMITFGIGLRMSNICPDTFIATFYVGLGFSLIIAGLSFFINFIRYLIAENEQITSEIDQ